MEHLTLGIVILAALADSINPCVFGVLIFLMAFMTKVFKKPVSMLLGGLFYSAVVYITYLTIGFGILTFTVSYGISVGFYWVAAIIAIIAGLIEMKDYFFYGKWFSLELIPGSAERIKFYTKKISKVHKKHPLLSILLLGLMGFFVVLVELPCTGAPYFAILALLGKSYYAQAVPYLLLYNLIFILPLFFIIGAVYFGKTSRILETWRKKHRGLMRLGIGLFLIALGLYMIYTIV